MPSIKRPPQPTTESQEPHVKHWKLDFESVKTICRLSQQVMVCGYSHCEYARIFDALDEGVWSREGLVKRVFTTLIGTTFAEDRPFRTTLEGSVIEQIEEIPQETDIDKRKICARESKAAITNLVFENFKREKRGLAPIPLIFCIDRSENPYSLHPVNFLSKEKEVNDLVTHAEIRRMYKLCSSFADLRIREIALKTFYFVRIEKVRYTYSLQPIQAPWMHVGWEIAWKQRQQLSQSISKQHPWKERLTSAIHMEDGVSLPRGERAARKAIFQAPNPREEQVVKKRCMMPKQENQ